MHVRQMPFKVMMNDGYSIEGWTAFDVVEELRRLDWEVPPTVLDFKRGFARRCEVAGMHLLFWSEDSFLQAAAQAKVFCLWIDGVEA